MSEYFKIGKMAASFGLKGELVLEHGLGKRTSLKGLETLFIAMSKNQLLPYFIESTAVKSANEIYIKLEGINSKESARLLTPKEVWLLEKDFQAFASGAAPIAMLGFHLMDGDTDLGPIVEVIEQPHQVLCTILIDGKEALVPVHEASLLKIDPEARQVHVSIPEGLLDIYR